MESANSSSSGGSSSSGSLTHKDVQQYIDSAVCYMMYEHDIEVHRCKKYEHLCEYLASLTRLITDRDGEERTTEIDWVMKAPKEKPPENISGKDKEQFELRQTWAAMLQMIPLMSKDKAQAFIRSNSAKWSCPRKVFDMFDSSSVQQQPLEKRKLIMQSEFGEGKNGVVRKEGKLAKHLHNVFTAVNPDALLIDI